ncbi:SulP family inorganic anion transporter [Chloroflexota bacterium]
MGMTGLKVPRKILINDLVSGLVMAVVSIPGALANGLLAGVSPVFGLYSMMAGTTVAALFTSSVIMNVDSTSATALATFEALSGVPQDQHLASLVVLGLLVGLFMLVLGFLKLGFLVRFISNAVMTGFLSGLGVLTILGQVGDLTAYYGEAGNKVVRTAGTILHWREIDPATLAVGLLTIVLILAVNRTRLEKYSFLVAVVVTTVLVAVVDPQTVAIVGDSTQILRTLPSLHLPDLSLVLSLITPALAIAIIALVQAAGVSGSVPNPDGDYPDPSGDFRGQGAGNIAVGLVGGLPVGGSLSGTFLIQSVGGKSRWANVFTGLFTLVAVLLIGPLIEAIPMPTLAGLLIVVGFSMIKVPRIRTVWHTGAAPATIMLTTFVATLFAPIQVAVALGVVLHILLYIFRSAEAVRLEHIVQQDDGAFVEAEVPAELPSGEIVILQPIGSLFFAGVAEFEEKLPDVGQARGTVVIFRLRDRDEVGSTFIRALDRYARTLQAGGNKLMLEGPSQHVVDQLEKTDLLDLIGEENVFPGQPEFGAALRETLVAAEEWLARDHDNSG